MAEGGRKALKDIRSFRPTAVRPDLKSIRPMCGGIRRSLSLNNGTRLKRQGLRMRDQCLITISHFRVPKTLTFKMRLGAQPFLWKWVLFARELKMISISKAQHLPSVWNRGPGELGNGLLHLWYACSLCCKVLSVIGRIDLKRVGETTAKGIHRSTEGWCRAYSN